MKTIFYCLLISSLSIYASCHKINCKQTIYSFEGFYKISPDLDSIRINDTIWLESIIPTQLKDLIRNQIVDYSGAENFGPSINYIEFTGGDILNPGGIPAANSFENILIKGSEVSSSKPDQVRGFLFKEEGGMYLFKIGILPKKKGTFAIAPSNAANVYTSKNKCDKASFSLTFKDTNQHLYLYQNNRPGYQISEGERLHTYCFKVY